MKNELANNPKAFTVAYYYHPYRVGQTKVYQYTQVAMSEDEIRERFAKDRPDCGIKWMEEVKRK